MNRRGEGVFGMSYGMIFSIIIIVSIIGVGFFTIRHFVSLSKCSQVGLFYEDLQEEIDRAWTSGIYRGTFEGKIPSSGISNLGLEKVCFGSLNDPSNSADAEIKEELDFYENPGNGFHVFVYPPENACGGDLFYKKIQHATTNQFFCTEVNLKAGTVSINLEKQTSDSLVKVSKS